MSNKKAVKLATKLAERLDAGKITWKQYTAAVNKLMYQIGYMDY